MGINSLPPNIYVIEKEIIPMLKNNKLSIYAANDFTCKLCPNKFEESDNSVDTKITNLTQRKYKDIDNCQELASKIFGNKRYNCILNKIKKVIYDSGYILDKKIKKDYKSKFINEY